MCKIHGSAAFVFQCKKSIKCTITCSGVTNIIAPWFRAWSPTQVCPSWKELFFCKIERKMCLQERLSWYMVAVCCTRRLIPLRSNQMSLMEATTESSPTSKESRVFIQSLFCVRPENLWLIEWSLSDYLWLDSHPWLKSDQGFCNWTVIRFHCGTNATQFWLKRNDASFGEKWCV